MPTAPQVATNTNTDNFADQLPHCPGIYRFLGQEGEVLYVGKSVNIRSRVRSHFAESSSTSRQRRLLHATRLIDCRPTAGEAGALLLENLAIKQQMPMFNRRQRALRRMWSIILEADDAGLLRPQLTCFSRDNPDVRAGYGSFANRYQARRALEVVARTESLCPRVLELERGRGPCFQYQIRRCLGACTGEESPAQHNARLLDALAVRRLTAWPSTAPLLLHERSEAPLSCQPAEEWHLLHNWMYMGTFASPEAARAAPSDGGFLFDRDTHRILHGVLRKGVVQLQRLDSGEPVVWPQDGQAG